MNDWNNNESLDDTSEMDHMIHGAFDRLRSDAGKVNAMTALHAHEARNTTPWFASPGALISGFAVIALLVVGATVLLGSNESVLEVEPPIAGETDNPEGTADEALAPVPADDVQVPTGSSFEELTGCGSTETNAADASVTTGDLLNIESYDDGTCRRTVFNFADGTAFGPDMVSVEPAPSGGVNISYPNEQELQPDVAEDRSVGFASQVLYWDGGYFLHVNHGQDAALTNVTVLANPTRIVVDTPTVEAPSELLIGTDVILPADLGVTTMPLNVVGYVAPGDNFPDEDYFVEVRRAPTVGQAGGTGELTSADWSGIEAIGDEEVTDSSYNYTVNPFGWYEFNFTLEGLAPGDYELVFLESNRTEVALIAPVTVIEATTIDDVNSPPLQTAAAADLPASFAPVVEELRSLTSAPITLPTEFGAESADEVFLTIVSADVDSYEVVVGLAPECFGGNACRLGTVTVFPHETGGVRGVEGTVVELANGQFGQFVPAECGATCTDGDIVWIDETYEYTFGLKAASIGQATEFALSARLIN